MPYKPRTLQTLVLGIAEAYPVVTITGPRQSGKTTLCRAVFPQKPYVNLEPLDVREYARRDPRGFLAEYPDGAVIDEIQHAPDLSSYIQVIVDERPEPGHYIVTGSQHFGLTRTITQSLAGRTAIVHLLPLSFDELIAFDSAATDLWQVVFQGGYPAIHGRRLNARRWLGDYLATYVERDLRQVSQIGNLEAFGRFMALAASRTAQETNLSDIGGDTGVSHNTIRAWMSVLEASFLVFRLPAWHRNLRKQLVKAPKLHIMDSGLACRLLGIRSADELRHHPLRGAIFESWVAAEIFKHRIHRGQPDGMFHFRSARGPEIDLVIQNGLSIIACEVKSGATLDESFLRPLRRFEALLSETAAAHRPTKRLVFGGDRGQTRAGTECIGWRDLHLSTWLQSGTHDSPFLA